MENIRKNTRKTQDEIVYRKATISDCGVCIVSPRSSLLHCLTRFFSNNHKEKSGNFINFSCIENDAIDPNHAVGRKPPIKWPIQWKEIPLQQKKTSSSILYVSALPQVVVRAQYPSLGLDLPDTIQLATQQLVEQLNNFQLTTISSDSNSNLTHVSSALSFAFDLWREFEIKADRSGWITFELSHQGIFHWLNHLLMVGQMPRQEIEQIPKRNFASATAIELPEQLLSRMESRDDSNSSAGYSKAQSNLEALDKTVVEERLWLLQHTFSRCSSYLKHAQSNSLLFDSLLFDALAEGNYRNDGSSAPIVTADTLAIDTRPARDLLQELVLTADAMFWIPYRYPAKQYRLILKQASLLCQAFQCFYGDCLPQNDRLLSAGKPYQSAAQQSRLVLTLAVHKTLKTLLESYFQETAPKSL